MSRSLIRAAMVLLGLVALGCAATGAVGNSGVPVHVTVLDETGRPIPTAVIRHPSEAERHRVNSVDGSWEEEVLYLPDGTPLVFKPGMLLDLEISAPGYISKTIQYEIVKRKNFIRIQLVRLRLDADDDLDEPELGFGRDRPIESGGAGGPSN
jgi:hypothetical protein